MNRTPNTTANGGQILTDEQIDSAWVAVNNGWGIMPRELIRKFARDIEAATLRASLADPAIGAGDPAAFFAEFCEIQGYPSDSEMDAPLRSAFYEGIRYCAVHSAAAPAIPTVDRNAVLDFSRAGAQCLSEDDCIAQGISNAGYERGVFDAIRACENIHSRAIKSADPASVPVQHSIDTDEFMRLYVAAADDLPNRDLYDNLIAYIHMHTARIVFACQREWEESASVPQPAAQVAVSEDQRDAERYRWLRDQHELGGTISFCVFQPCGDRNDIQHVRKMPGELSKAIDAALATPATVKTAEGKCSQSD